MLKFHVQLHVPGDIQTHGSMSNTDTATGESNHKVICKRTAKNTQHRLHEFDYQCAVRYSEDLVLDRAMSVVNQLHEIILENHITRRRCQIFTNLELRRINGRWQPIVLCQIVNKVFEALDQALPAGIHYLFQSRRVREQHV